MVEAGLRVARPSAQQTICLELVYKSLRAQAAKSSIRADGSSSRETCKERAAQKAYSALELFMAC
jgi:hypothetical protein